MTLHGDNLQAASVSGSVDATDGAEDDRPPAPLTDARDGPRRAVPAAPARTVRGLFVTFGAFSSTNAALLGALRDACPNVAFETFDLSPEVRGRPGRLLRCVAGAAMEYGPLSMRSARRARYNTLHSRAFYEMASSLAQARAADGGFALTLQTQSLFNAAAPGVPNYVYTDHTAQQRAGEPGEMQPTAAWSALERRIYADAAHVFTFGGATRRSVMDDYGRDGGDVTAVGAGVRPARRGPMGADAFTGRRILFVGREWERKGGPELVEAFAALRRRLPDATLTVVGCRPRLRVPGCEVLGPLPPDAVDAQFRRCTCFCMPSHVEPYGLVYAEAMAHGRPVVATTVGAVPEIVLDGETGHLVPPGDVPALTDALVRVLSEPRHAQSLGQRGLARAEAFTWSATAARIGARIRPTVGRGGNGGPDGRGAEAAGIDAAVAPGQGDAA